MKTLSYASTILDRLQSRGLSRSRPNGAIAMLSTFTMGLAVGVGLGVLFAPQSGEESRRVVRTKAQELYARAMSTLGKATAKVGEKTDAKTGDEDTASDTSADASGTTSSEAGDDKPRDKQRSGKRNGPGAQA